MASWLGCKCMSCSSLSLPTGKFMSLLIFIICMHNSLQPLTYYDQELYTVKLECLETGLTSISGHVDSMWLATCNLHNGLQQILIIVVVGIAITPMSCIFLYASHSTHINEGGWFSGRCFYKSHVIHFLTHSIHSIHFRPDDDWSIQSKHWQSYFPNWSW